MSAFGCVAMGLLVLILGGMIHGVIFREILREGKTADMWTGAMTAC